MSKLFLVCLAALAAGLVRPEPAQACECARPGVEVSPGAGAAVPTNTVVRVSWWVGQVKIEESTLQIVPAEAPKPAKPARKKDKDVAPAATIDLDVAGSTLGQVRTVTLRPKAPLAPLTRYEVRVASAAGEKAGVIAEFTTGAATDDKPPEWSGAVKAAYVQKPAVCCNCSTSDPYAQIDLPDEAKLTDDATPGAAIVYGIWADEARPDAPPLLVTRSWSGKLYLGHKSECSPVNFELGKPGTLKLRVAPIDLAGHVGKPASVSVEVPKPTLPPAVRKK